MPFLSKDRNFFQKFYDSVKEMLNLAKITKTSGINSMNAIERNIPPEKVFEIPINFWFV